MENTKQLQAEEIQQQIQSEATKKTFDRKKKTVLGIYTPIMITKRVAISIVNVGDNIKQTLEKFISNSIEGKCIVEGFIKTGSTKVISYSSGELIGADVIYEVIIECLTCCPVEGMLIDCIAKNITETAGIKAEIDETPSPLIIYFARDHHYNNKHFGTIKVGDTIKARVIGQRFELNDKYISIIAELVEEKNDFKPKTNKRATPKTKRRLVIKN